LTPAAAPGSLCTPWPEGSGATSRRTTMPKGERSAKEKKKPSLSIKEKQAKKKAKLAAKQTSA